MDTLLYSFNSFNWLIPESFFLFGILMILIYGVVLSVSPSYNYPLLVNNLGVISILMLVITGILLINGLFGGAVSIFDLFISDSFGSYTKIVLTMSTVVVILLSMNYLKLSKINAFEFYLLVLLSVLGMYLICSSFDLISVYLSIEFQSLCFYVLASLKKHSEYSTEAGLKYFVLGAFSSGLLLMGSLLIYGSTGTTSFEGFSKLYLPEFSMTLDSSLTLGLIVFLMGLCFKLYSAPFHVWVPDVYEGSPTIVTTFFSTVPFISIVVLFSRVLFYSFIGVSSYWSTMLGISAVFSLIVGVLGSLAQYKVKRLIAYSAIGHSGYLLLAYSSGRVESLTPIYFYILVYIIASFGFFSALMSVRKVGYYNSIQNRLLTDFTNLRFLNPALAISISLILFSMAGIPPLLGFFSKYFIFIELLYSHLYIYSGLALLASIIGCVYYLRLIKIMYFIPSENYTFYYPVSKSFSYITSSSVIFLLFGIADPYIIYWIAEEISSLLYHYN